MTSLLLAAWMENAVLWGFAMGVAFGAGMGIMWLCWEKGWIRKTKTEPPVKIITPTP